MYFLWRRPVVSIFHSIRAQPLGCASAHGFPFFLYRHRFYRRIADKGPAITPTKQSDRPLWQGQGLIVKLARKDNLGKNHYRKSSRTLATGI